MKNREEEKVMQTIKLLNICLDLHGQGEGENRSGGCGEGGLG